MREQASNRCCAAWLHGPKSRTNAAWPVSFARRAACVACAISVLTIQLAALTFLSLPSSKTLCALRK